MGVSSSSFIISLECQVGPVLSCLSFSFYYKFHIKMHKNPKKKFPFFHSWPLSLLCISPPTYLPTLPYHVCMLDINGWWKASSSYSRSVLITYASMQKIHWKYSHNFKLPFSFFYSFCSMFQDTTSFHSTKPNHYSNLMYGTE